MGQNILIMTEVNIKIWKAKFEKSLNFIDNMNP